MNKKVLVVASIMLTGALLMVLTLSALSADSTRRDEFVKYRFIVEIDAVTLAYFMEVRGVNVTIDVIEVREGVEPNNVRLLPGPVHYGPLVLVSGVTENTELLDWIMSVADGSAARRNLSVIILDPLGNEVARYNISDAWPSSWSLGELDSLGVGPVIEELVIQYEKMERVG